MSKDHFVHDTGKGSRPRDVDREKFENNWDRIFGKKQQEIKEIESVFTCMHCNTVNDPNDAICKNCGQPAGSYPGDSNRI